MTTKNADVLASEVLTAINDKDYSTLDRLTSEDVQLRFPPGQLFSGRPSLEHFLRTVEGRLPQLTLIGHTLHTGDGFAVVEYEVTGTSAAKTAHESLGCLVLLFDDADRVKRVTLYMDTAQWQELGRAIGG